MMNNGGCCYYRWGGKCWRRGEQRWHRQSEAEIRHWMETAKWVGDPCVWGGRGETSLSLDPIEHGKGIPGVLRSHLTVPCIAKNKCVVFRSYFLPDKENSHSARILNVCGVFKGTVTRIRFQISCKCPIVPSNLWQGTQTTSILSLWKMNDALLFVQ